MLPNTLIRSYLLALEDLLGENGVKAFLNHSSLSGWIESYPPANDSREVTYEEFSLLQKSVEDIYGERMGRNLARRASRRSFEQVGLALISIEENSDEHAPPEATLKHSLRAFARLFSIEDLDQIRLAQSDDEIVLAFDRCPNCVGRTVDEPMCQACIGWIEALLSERNPGGRYEVIETGCLAAGDASCTFSIRPA